MYFIPRLSNGHPAPLPFQMKFIKVTGSWPIQLFATTLTQYWDRILVFTGFVLFCFINEAELHYLFDNVSNVSLAMEGMATYLVLVEAQLRSNGIAFRKKQCRELLDEFFKTIYVDQ